MYNGIGLRTTRGSGTSGHVQKNLSLFIPKPSKNNTNDLTSNIKVSIQNDPELIRHENLRKLEVELLNYSEDLQAKGLKNQDLEEALQKKRQELIHRLHEASEVSLEQGDLDSNQISRLKEKELEIFREAIGIDTENRKKKHGENHRSNYNKTTRGRFRNEYQNDYFKKNEYTGKKVFNNSQKYYKDLNEEINNDKYNKKRYQEANYISSNFQEPINSTSSESNAYIINSHRRKEHKNTGRYSKKSSSSRNLAIFGKRIRREKQIYKRSRRSRSPSTVSRYRSLSRSLSP